ncbi:MAG: hypothetical protein LW862_20495, partial [Rubrivivax sp.]|nr:hypothetical protein [Rubrivivax sp.]
MSESSRMDPQQVFERLRSLRGAPHDQAYWAQLCTCLVLLCRARAAIVVRAGDGGEWRVLGAEPVDETSLRAQASARLAELAPRALAQGHAYAPDAQGQLVAAVRMVDPEG